ncbi:MAG: M67 family metallopeptidase, partial [Chloroflexi bacterium]|nr:M67 family metallopeptidase [Chloroflexota bacterium]
MEHRFAQEMIAHAREDAPNECCGMLAGSDGKVAQVYRTANAYHSPLRYSIDPREILRVANDMSQKGWRELGVYHSHVFSEAYPSQTDVSLALLTGWLGAEFYYFLVSLKDRANPQLRAYTIEVEDEAPLGLLREHLAT